MEPNTNLPWIIFELKHQLYAVSTAFVTGISTIPFITGVAGSPEMFLGVCNIRGVVVPVLNLKDFLKIADESSDIEKILTALSYKSEGVDNYLKELHRCADAGEKFTASPDYFGDQISSKGYHANSETAAFIKRIHSMQGELEDLAKSFNSGEDVLNMADVSGKRLKNAIAEAIEFISDTSKRMMISLSDNLDSMQPCIAFTVDTVKGVDELEIISSKENNQALFVNNQIYGVAHNDKLKGEILIVDERTILNTINVYNESVKKEEKKRKDKEAQKKL